MDPNSQPNPTQQLPPQIIVHSNNTLIILFSILTLILLGSTGFLYYQNLKLQGMVANNPQVSTSPTPSSTPQISTNNQNWQTYQNRNLGFSLDYPLFLKVTESVGKVIFTEVLHLVEGPTGPLSQDYQNTMTISVEKSPSNKTLNDWIQTIYGKDPLYSEIKTSEKELSIDGIKGVSIDVPGAAAYIDHNVLLIANGNFYRIHILLLDESGSSQLFDQILSTFKFLSPTSSPSAGLSCTYNNKTYQNGQGFPATDGCNSCSCTNGQVACTLIACPKSQ